MEKRVIKIGNSLAVIIPKNITKQANILKGTEVQIDFKDGVIEIYKKYSHINEIQITKDNEHEEIKIFFKEENKMGREEIIKRLKEVQEMKLSKMNYEKLKLLNKVPRDFEETEENIKLMNNYLVRFLDPKNEQFENNCWLCDNKFISLNWGLAHGVAYSNCCGLSYICYHYSGDISKEKELFKERILLSLQYHPDTFSINEEDQE